VKSTIALILVLSGVWLLWSGHLDPLLLSLGAASVLSVVAIIRRMGLMDDETAPLGLPLRAPLFLPWLFWEIVKANVDVARRITDPRLPISPRLIRVKAGQKEDLGRVIYANCITLTPGTVSVDVENAEITVHALTREAAAGIQSGVMDRKVTRFEGAD
jgi:multicomponent Na+:H+ antiporter subunit E